MIGSSMFHIGRSSRASQPRQRRSRGIVAVEAAVVTPVFLLILLGVWEIGRLIQVSIVLNEAAREGARLAAGGAANVAPATVAAVQQRVKDCLKSEGFPQTAVDHAIVTVTNLSDNMWTDPCDAGRLDPFSITVTIPPGPEAFDSLKWVLSSVSGITQITTTVKWLSANDDKVQVSGDLPF